MNKKKITNIAIITITNITVNTLLYLLSNISFTSVKNYNNTIYIITHNQLKVYSFVRFYLKLGYKIVTIHCLRKFAYFTYSFNGFVL